MEEKKQFNLKNFVNDTLIEVMMDIKRDKQKYAHRKDDLTDWNELVHESQISKTLMAEELLLLNGCKLMIENNKKSVFTRPYLDDNLIENTPTLEDNGNQSN